MCLDPTHSADFFHLWSLAEQDLLSETVRYRLMDTGQGLNRVQGAPKTSRMMHSILNRAQKSVGSWVGSSVIHLGDRDVPNALNFIGKTYHIACSAYSQLLPQISIRKYTGFSCRYARHSVKSLRSTLPQWTAISQVNSGRQMAFIGLFSPISSGMASMVVAPITSTMRAAVLTVASQARGIGVVPSRRRSTFRCSFSLDSSGLMVSGEYSRYRPHVHAAQWAGPIYSLSCLLRL
jgi:hypothetical protein